MENKIRLKGDDESTVGTGRKSRESKIDSTLREQIKKEIMAEIMAELGLGTTDVDSDEPPIVALKKLVTKQNARFKDLNPIADGVEFFEVRRGEKLLRVNQKMDGTKIYQYIGRISKNPTAKQMFDIAKKEGKLTYR